MIGQEHVWELDDTTKPRRRRTRSRSFISHTPRFTSHGQKRHASALPARELNISPHFPDYQSSSRYSHASPNSSSAPSQQSIPQATHPPPHPSTSRYTITTSTSFESLTEDQRVKLSSGTFPSNLDPVQEFLRCSAQDHISRYPLDACRAYGAVVDAGLSSEVSSTSINDFVRNLSATAVREWAFDYRSPHLVWASQLEDVAIRYAGVLEDRRIWETLHALRGSPDAALRVLKSEARQWEEMDEAQRIGLVERFNMGFVASYRTFGPNQLSTKARQLSEIKQGLFFDILQHERSAPVRHLVKLMVGFDPFVGNDLRQEAAQAELLQQMDKRTRIGTKDWQMRVKFYSLCAENLGMHALLDNFDLDYPFESLANHRPQLPHDIFRPAFMTLAASPRPMEDARREWEARLAQAGLGLSEPIAYQLLKYYVRHGMAASVAALLTRVWKENVVVESKFYSKAITYASQRGDPRLVEALMWQMMKQKVPITKENLHSAMNAYAEAGLWAGVLKIPEFMKRKGIEEDIVTRNLILKACRRLGIPFDTLQQQLEALLAAGFTPDGHTYTILMQSAIDSGDILAARKLYRQVLERNKSEPGFLKAQPITILVQAYLHQGSFKRAALMYREFERHGVQPTSLTFNKMLTYAQNLKNPRQQEMVYAEVRERVKANWKWKLPTGGKTPWYHHIYHPLMNQALANGSLEGVEGSFMEGVNMGYNPTISMKTVLLDALRWSGKIEPLVQLWNEIFQDALAIKDATLAAQPEFMDKSASWTRSDILSVPFSIYIDALSRAGMHEEVVGVCEAMHQNGFKFSVDNWNHLGVALVRGGNIVGAFAVADMIVQRRLYAASYTPKVDGRSARLFNHPSGFRSDLMDPQSNRYSRPPLRSLTNRREALFWMRSKIPELRNKGETDVNLIQPAELLRKLLPSVAIYNYWRTFRELEEVLIACLCNLEDGYPIIPSGPGGTHLPACGDHNPELARDQLNSISGMKLGLNRIRRLMQTAKRDLGEEGFDANFRPGMQGREQSMVLEGMTLEVRGQEGDGA